MIKCARTRTLDAEGATMLDFAAVLCVLVLLGLLVDDLDRSSRWERALQARLYRAQERWAAEMDRRAEHRHPSGAGPRRPGRSSGLQPDPTHSARPDRGDAAAVLLAHLKRTGWSLGIGVVVGPHGRAWLVWGANREARIHAEGPTLRAAWHRAVEQVRWLELRGRPRVGRG